MKNFVQKIKPRFKGQNLAQRARDIGISYTILWNILNGRTRQPKQEYVDLIQAYLDRH
jgi:hypothetical protein